MENKAEINNISRFRVGLERIVYKLEKIIEMEEPIIYSDLWRERINAIAKIRNINCDINDTYPESLRKRRREAIPTDISDEKYLEIIKSIVAKSKRRFWSRYNLFLDELEELIKNSATNMQPLIEAHYGYEPFKNFNWDYKKIGNLSPSLDEMKKACNEAKNQNKQLMKRNSDGQKRLDQLKRDNSQLRTTLEKRRTLLQQYQTEGLTAKDFQKQKDQAKKIIEEESAKHEKKLRDEISDLKKENQALEDELLFLKIKLAEQIDKNNITNQVQINDDANTYTNQSFM